MKTRAQPFRGYNDCYFILGLPTQYALNNIYDEVRGDLILYGEKIQINLLFAQNLY